MYWLKSSTSKVIDILFYCYYSFIPFASSLFYPSAYIGCWWDLRRDPFIFIFALYFSLVHSGVCVVFRLSTVSIHIRPRLYHSDLLAIIDAPHQYIDIRRFCQLHRNQGWCLTTTIAHSGIESHDPTAPSDGHRTSIFGRIGTRRLGTVVSTISSVVWPSQGSSECSLRISLG
jgi:hypothetical protein